MKKGLKRMGGIFLFVLMLLPLIAFTACDNEWDSAIKNTISAVSSDKANYLLSTTCIYGVGKSDEYGYKEKVYVGGGKYYSVRTNLDGSNEETGSVSTGSYPFIRKDYGNDAPYHAMLLGSIIGKFDYFTPQDGKYVLSDEKKEDIAARILEIGGNLDVVTEMYYVFSGGKVSEFYVLLDRSSGAAVSPTPPMSVYLTLEYGNVTI